MEYSYCVTTTVTHIRFYCKCTHENKTTSISTFELNYNNDIMTFSLYFIQTKKLFWWIYGFEKNNCVASVKGGRSFK